MASSGHAAQGLQEAEALAPEQIPNIDPPSDSPSDSPPAPLGGSDDAASLPPGPPAPAGTAGGESIDVMSAIYVELFTLLAKFSEILELLARLPDHLRNDVGAQLFPVFDHGRHAGAWLQRRIAVMGVADWLGFEVVRVLDPHETDEPEGRVLAQTPNGATVSLPFPPPGWRPAGAVEDVAALAAGELGIPNNCAPRCWQCERRQAEGAERCYNCTAVDPCGPNPLIHRKGRIS